MTDHLTEAQIAILSKTAAEADGGCIFCVAGITMGLMEAFPGRDWITIIAEVEFSGFDAADLRLAVAKQTYD